MRATEAGKLSNFIVAPESAVYSCCPLGGETGVISVNGNETETVKINYCVDFNGPTPT